MQLCNSTGLFVHTNTLTLLHGLYFILFVLFHNIELLPRYHDYHKWSKNHRGSRYSIYQFIIFICKLFKKDLGQNFISIILSLLPWSSYFLTLLTFCKWYHFDFCSLLTFICSQPHDIDLLFDLHRYQEQTRIHHGLSFFI